MTPIQMLAGTIYLIGFLVSVFIAWHRDRDNSAGEGLGPAGSAFFAALWPLWFTIVVMDWLDRHVGRKLALDVVFDRIAANRIWRYINRAWFGCRYNRVELHRWLAKQTMAVRLTVVVTGEVVLREHFYVSATTLLLDRIDKVLLDQIDKATSGRACLLVQVFSENAADDQPYAGFTYRGSRNPEPE